VAYGLGGPGGNNGKIRPIPGGWLLRALDRDLLDGKTEGAIRS
jgi:hypothetical protein